LRRLLLVTETFVNHGSLAVSSEHVQ